MLNEKANILEQVLEKLKYYNLVEGINDKGEYSFCNLKLVQRKAKSLLELIKNQDNYENKRRINTEMKEAIQEIKEYEQKTQKRKSKSMEETDESELIQKNSFDSNQEEEKLDFGPFNS